MPVELIERNAPMLVHYKQLRADSGGAGQFRGGLGQEMELEILSPTPVGLIFMAERCKFPAPGMRGGGDGATGEVRIDGTLADYRKNMVLTQGQRVTLKTPGGAGMGAPEKRDGEAGTHDRREGYVTR